MTLRSHNSNDPDRRRVLQGALAGAAGAVLAGPDGLLRQTARAADPTKKAKACIVL